MQRRQADRNFSSGRFRRIGWALLGMLGLAMFLLAGCTDNGGGKNFPEIPSNEIGQFNILAASPYPDDIAIGTLPAQLLPAVAGSYVTAAETFAQWANALGESAGYAQSQDEPFQDLLTAQSIFQALATACGNLGAALYASDATSGQSAASAMATALNDLADMAQQDGFSTLSQKFTDAALQADALATQIGQGMSTSDQLIALFQADQAFRQSLQAVADEISEMTSGYSLPMQSRAINGHYYVVTNEFLVITQTPLSATSWVLISPGHYMRTVTWNRQTTEIETQTSYLTLWDAIWNVNGYNFTQLSQTISQTQVTTTEHFFSVSGSPSANLPPVKSYVFIERRTISIRFTTGAVGGG